MPDPGRAQRIAERFLLVPSVDALFGVTPVGISDISLTGTRLRHGTELQVGAKAILRFEPEPGGRPASIEGEIVWTQPTFSLEENEKYASGFRAFGFSDLIGQSIEKFEKQGRLHRIEEFRSTDRFILVPPIAGQFSLAGGVRIDDLSARGARICALSKLYPGTKGLFSFRLDDPSLEISVEAEVAWCRVKALGSDGRQSYHAGLKIQERPELIRLAIGQLTDRKRATKDTYSLGLKLKIARAQRHLAAKAIRHERGPAADYFPVIDAVWQELRGDPNETRRWSEQARIAISDGPLREVVAPICDKQEALAVWEYLDRTVDPSIIALRLQQLQ